MTKEYFLKDFSNNLAYVMNYSWIDVKQLSELTGLSESIIRYYLKGERMPSAANVVSIAHALRCHVEDLIDTSEIVR